MEIRFAANHELDKVRDTALSAHDMYREVLSSENRAKMLQGVSRIAEVASDGTLFVADLDSEIAGAVVYLPPGSPRPDIFRGEWGIIRMLSVSPEHRGRGIGRALSEACIREAAGDGAGEIALHTGEMMSAARKIYESLGFRILREIEPRFGFRYWLYTKQLPAR